MTAVAARTRRLRRTAGAVLMLGLVSACTGLPTSGQVRRQPDSDTAAEVTQPYFAPPGPRAGDTPSEVVRGFLLAMQANPLSTSVARGFLTSRAKSEWRPDQATVVYAASAVAAVGVDPGVATGVDPGGDPPSATGVREAKVVTRLSDAHRLDRRGGWLNGPTGRTERLELGLRRESGQWRIDDPVDALVVPESYFEGRFAPFSLFFFDQTGRVLVPDTVFIPRGEQTATNLVRGLIAGPGRLLRPVVRNAFPATTDLDLSVLVSDAGVAEVPLSATVDSLAPADLNRVVVQLTRTLRQVPGINRVRITVDGTPVPLPDGSVDTSVDRGSTMDPTAQDGTGDLVALHQGRAVSVGPDGARAVDGAFGRAGYALRSLALRPDGRQLAAISQDGRSLFTAAREGSGGVRRVARGEDLLPASYDGLGGLWAVDRSGAGAVVHHVARGVDRVLRVPGVSGRDVVALAASRDGTRLAVALAGGKDPRVVVARVVRTVGGGVTRVVRALPAPLASADLGPALDLGWVSPTSLAVLSTPPNGGVRLTFAADDGSPRAPGSLMPERFPSAAVGLATSIVPGRRPVLVTATGKLVELDDAGRWQPRAGLTQVSAVAYAG